MGGIVLPPQHHIRVIIIITDAEVPPVLAQALANADALLLAVVFDLHGATVRTSDGGPPLSSHATTAIVPVNLVRVVASVLLLVLVLLLLQCTERRKDGSGRSDTLLLTEGSLEEIFFPVGDRLLAGRLGDGLWKKPGGAITFAIAEASCYFFLLFDTGLGGDGGFERPDAMTGGQRQARDEEPRGCGSVSVHGVGLGYLLDL